MEKTFRNVLSDLIPQDKFQRFISNALSRSNDLLPRLANMMVLIATISTSVESFEAKTVNDILAKANSLIKQAQGALSIQRRKDIPTLFASGILNELEWYRTQLIFDIIDAKKLVDSSTGIMAKPRSPKGSK